MSDAVAPDEVLVRRLIEQQFPHWVGLAIRRIVPGGWDNRSFRLGDELVVRLPSAEAYAGQAGKEQRWLPKLAPFLPVPIPTLVVAGRPTQDLPWPWSICRWLEGEPVVPGQIADPVRLARELAQFLVALQAVDPADGPQPGQDNFHRGGSLSVYDAEAREAIASLDGTIDVRAAADAWSEALATTWNRAPIWVHGDVSAGNLLMLEGRLGAVIDFGNLAVGDPACDLAAAWTLFEGAGRDAFRAMLPFDTGTWARARGWVLWKALILAAGTARTNAVEWHQPLQVIADVLADRTRSWGI